MTMTSSAAPRAHYTATFAVLATAVGAYALLQSLVIPVLPTIQAGLHTSQNNVTWVLTGYLLSASIFTPIVGRMGDMWGKERMLIAAPGRALRLSSPAPLATDAPPGRPRDRGQVARPRAGAPAELAHINTVEARRRPTCASSASRAVTAGGPASTSPSRSAACRCRRTARSRRSGTCRLGGPGATRRSCDARTLRCPCRACRTTSGSCCEPDLVYFRTIFGVVDGP